MTRETIQVVTDDAVAQAALGLIKEAQEYVVLVSPYNAFWTHLKNEITFAMERGARVTAVYNPVGGYARGDGVEWLVAAGATVYRLPNLHAKLYLNESAALLSSMNLTERSSRNSMDVGMLARGGAAYAALRDYAVRLTKLAERVERPIETDAPPQERRREPQRADSIRDKIDWIRTELPGEVVKHAKTLLRRGGYCVRCRTPVKYAPADSPLCERCYAEWSRFRNPRYGEKHCHKCGDPAQTTYAKPLCAACYAKP